MPRASRGEPLGAGGSEVARAPVHYPGWSAHFRVVPWDNRREVPYRVRHGSEAVFEGLIRKNAGRMITVILLSCFDTFQLTPCHV